MATPETGQTSRKQIFACEGELKEQEEDVIKTLIIEGEIVTRQINGKPLRVQTLVEKIDRALEEAYSEFGDIEIIANEIDFPGRGFWWKGIV